MKHKPFIAGGKTRDMTRGRPLGLIVRFALPIMAGNALQQIYSLVDSLVIGRAEGVTALAAVSASGWLDWAVLSIPMGLAQGYSIQAAHCYGGRDYAGVMDALTELAQPIDAFFDGVMVMDKDEMIRRNRLALLKSIECLIEQAADFDKIVF